MNDAIGPLPQLALLRFAGPDSATFLQGQVSNDIRRLEAGAPLLAAYSTPQGRVVSVLHLLPHSSGIMALLPRDLALPTLERLRKYVLRAKVRIEDVSDELAVFGRIGMGPPPIEDLPTPAADQAYVERSGIGVARVTGGGDRCWIIGSLPDLTRATGMPDTELSWRLADIRAGLPQIYAATSEVFVAQMLNLDLIDGISFNKGCYTGQEIIARTQHLGRIKRRLHRLRLPDGAWEVGQAIQLADGRSGRLTEVAPDGAHFEALAVLTRETGSGAEAASSLPIDATELPLPYSPGSA